MRKKYPTDLSERGWAQIEKHFRVSYKKGGKNIVKDRGNFLCIAYRMPMAGMIFRYGI